MLGSSKVLKSFHPGVLSHNGKFQFSQPWKAAVIIKGFSSCIAARRFTGYCSANAQHFKQIKQIILITQQQYYEMLWPTELLSGNTTDWPISFSDCKTVSFWQLDFSHLYRPAFFLLTEHLHLEVIFLHCAKSKILPFSWDFPPITKTTTSNTSLAQATFAHLLGPSTSCRPDHTDHGPSSHTLLNSFASLSW